MRSETSSAIWHHSAGRNCKHTEWQHVCTYRACRLARAAAPKGLPAALSNPGVLLFKGVHIRSTFTPSRQSALLSTGCHCL